MAIPTVWGAILSTVSGMVQPIADLIDELHTSDEEKLTLQQKFFALQTALYSKVMDMESQLFKSQSRIIEAEAKSDSWLTKNWRPLTMVVFVFLVVNRWTGIGAVVGLPPLPIPAEFEMELWMVIKLGIGGYIGGRSLEKIVQVGGQVFKDIKNKG